MSDVVIRAEGLVKKYLIGHKANFERNATFRDVIVRTAKGLAHSALDMARGRQLVAGDEIEEFWALKDVNFEIRRGEVVGIIGRNGAGKSTLLKILSRITEPSEGRVEIKGRVSSLLEVGTGFHPELTGRENVYLNGAILGMTRAEIQKKFDEIVAFAEVEKFLDTPVKRYSSGMYVRLAFAVAAHLEPEILIVDEVLAVGDAQFQKKCIGTMNRVARNGRTVLLVSHNLRTIGDLCTRSINMDRGTIAASGPPRDVIAHYVSVGGANQREWRPAPVPGAVFTFQSVRVEPVGGTRDSPISYSDPLEIVMLYTVSGDLPPSRLAIKLVNEEGVTVLASADTDALPSINRPWPKGPSQARCRIPGCLLTPGRYQVDIAEPARSGSSLVHENVLSFTVSDFGSPNARDARSCLVTPMLSWTVEEVH